jgi:hypothetical protein
MNEIANSSKPFIDQIPKRDRKYLKHLKAVYDIDADILWTSKGWRYRMHFK